MSKEKFRLSPSAIRAYWSYLNGDTCGLLFNDMYYDKTGVKIKETEKMLAGKLFEYLAAGIVGRDGEIPQALLTPTGKFSTKNTGIQEQAERFRKTVEQHKMDMFDVSVTLETDMGNYVLKSITDVCFEKDGLKGLIELKYSGLLGNKWEEYGWEASTLNKRRVHLIQAACNIISARELWGQEHVPYYFYVASATNSEDAALFEVVFDERALAEYTDMIENAYLGIIVEAELGFRAYPDYKRCADCPLAESCFHKSLVPGVTKIVVPPLK